jgi:hypothetical protein
MYATSDFMNESRVTYLAASNSQIQSHVTICIIISEITISCQSLSTKISQRRQRQQQQHKHESFLFADEPSFDVFVIYTVDILSTFYYLKFYGI